MWAGPRNEMVYGERGHLGTLEPTLGILSYQEADILMCVAS